MGVINSEKQIEDIYRYLPCAHTHEQVTWLMKTIISSSVFPYELLDDSRKTVRHALIAMRTLKAHNLGSMKNFKASKFSNNIVYFHPAPYQHIMSDKKCYQFLCDLGLEPIAIIVNIMKHQLNLAIQDVTLLKHINHLIIAYEFCKLGMYDKVTAYCNFSCDTIYPNDDLKQSLYVVVAMDNQVHLTMRTILMHEGDIFSHDLLPLNLRKVTIIAMQQLQIFGFGRFVSKQTNCHRKIHTFTKIHYYTLVKSIHQSTSSPQATILRLLKINPSLLIEKFLLFEMIHLYNQLSKQTSDIPSITINYEQNHNYQLELLFD